MVEFLSAAWVAALDAAARAADDLATDRPLVVETSVHRASGDTGHQVAFGPAGATVSVAGTRPADVVLVTDLDTAWALHQGDVRAQDALARGRLKVRGRPEVLAERGDLLAAFERASAPVRRATTPCEAPPDGR